MSFQERIRIILSVSIALQAAFISPALPEQTAETQLKSMDAGNDPDDAELRAMVAAKHKSGKPTDVLSLKRYLEQVRAQNESVRSSHLLQKSYDQRSLEPQQEFSPILTGDFSDGKVKSPPIPAQAAFMPIETTGYRGSLGINKKWSTGTLTQLSYNAQYGNTTFPTFPADIAWQNSATLSISQPLFKDFNAHLSKYAQDKITNTFLMAKALEEFKIQQVLAQAEGAYWRLVAARSVTEYKAETLLRTRKLHDWSAKRVRMNVSDRSDLIQAQAALKLRTLELQMAREEQVTAARALNTFREVDGEGVPETLEPMTDAEIQAARAQIQQQSSRLDLQAAEMDLRAKRAEFKEAREKTKPDISLYASATRYGRNPDFSAASNQSVTTDYDNYAIGVKFSVPLDFHLISEVRQGYGAAAQAAEVNFTRKNFELSQDWKELKKRFNDTIARLETARELEKLQAEKLGYERTRLSRGRSTNFQVLTFEEDYSNAQLNRLRIEADVLSLRAQARLFNGETL